MDVSIAICGAAGQGIQTLEELVVGMFKSAGYHVYATKEYESRVRGGLNSTTIRIGSDRVNAPVRALDVVVPFSKPAIHHLTHRLTPRTIIIADTGVFKDEPPQPELQLFVIPFETIAEQLGNRIYANVIAAGAITGLFCIEKEIGTEYLTHVFLRKGDAIVKANHQAYLKGHEHGFSLQEQYPLFPARFCVDKTPSVQKEMLLSGIEAIGLGAIAGGCNFISAYPMSPSTGLLQFLARHSNTFEIVVDQAEDEIAAINKAIGAWYTGARAIVSTSGGGFDLMTEGLSLAGIIESPLVIHLAQRPGPATGLPTRTAQEDLNLALHAGHGEFARIIFAPGTIDQAFWLTQKAFNLADRYQIPVFLLSDQNFVDNYYNLPIFNIDNLKNDHSIIATMPDYKRYQLTEDGISPRGIPGYGSGLVRVDSDEHDEEGYITEDVHYTRPEMVKKRYIKRMALLREIVDLPTWIGSRNAEHVVICWGSNYHVVEEAIERLGNPKIAMVHFHQLFPLSSKVHALLRAIPKLYSVENNAGGQFALLLKLEVDITIPPHHQLLQYN